MLDRIFDMIVGFMLNRDLEKEIGIRHKLLKGRVWQIPSKIFDRLVNLMMGTRYSYYLEMRRNMLEGGVVEMPSNIFDWKALERASGYLRVYMEDFHDQFKENYDGNFPVEDFKDWFRHFHVERPERETTKKSVSEALLADDLPRV
ncbi:MAG: hypothetical protein OXU27_14730 [Candidatus Poribacteria bacterium]|nr:hypothetical protein [Candidatus Poribacteria bacterium]MDD9975267.1 hypothetical protein [Candidatus Poribacteria bacterium]MDE0322686.1 hypothetical protein [Candidatus Poribacteria bacterium]